MKKHSSEQNHPGEMQAVTRRRASLSLTGVLLMGTLLAVGGLQAQTRTWTTTTPTGDSGNWSDTTKWSGSDVPDTAGENATFGAYNNNRSVALDGNYTIGTLTIVPRTSGFNAQTFALTGTNTLTLNSGFIVGGGTSVSIAPNLVIAADQTWNTQNETGTASVALNGIISGAGKITRTANAANTSAGIITFSAANTFSGGLTQTAAFNTTRLGSSSNVGGGVITDGPLGTGTVTLNAGTLSSNGGTARTLHNNIVIGGTVNLGNSSQTGALTFSDAGLTTASTFTLGSANNGNVSVLRLGGTNVTIDQVIAESGGTGQSVNFASTSGTPTVTLGRTKTATGNILVGGVNLVLNNGAANSGSLMGVNGSITATGGNKFSTGGVYADGTNLIATDATNFSEIKGGQASVYNNGRVSFATDQTQAMVAGLFTSDSQLRLGLGSGSGSATVTENYNQSAIGNGKAGLVSASTGTITYNGALTAGSDNTYRVGGGLGTLALTSALTGTGSNLIIEGGGTLTTSADNTFTGSTTINSSATLTGANGALSGTSGVSVNNASTLTLNNATGAVNANRISDTAGITLNNSFLALSGTSTGALTETVGNLTIGAGGRNFVTIATTPSTGNVKTLQFGNLVRNNNAVVTFRGDTLGTSATARNEIKFTAAPTLIGGGGADGTTTISILPWARGGTAAANASTGFVTYGANGIRRLDNTTEFVQANNNTTARIDQAIATAGGATNYNVRSAPGTTGGATLVNTASSNVTLNSLLFDNTAATAANTYGFNSSTINVTSGAVHIQNSVAFNLTLNSGTLAFGAAEGVITNNANGFYLTTLSTVLTGSNGVSIYNVNGGGISLGATNTFTGGLTFGGNGFVGVDQDGRMGAAGGSVTHGGGTLQFFSAFTSTRALTLLGNVGDNILANNTTSSNVIWNGDISGGGLLRLINNASTTGPGGFSLGGSNTYTGGTQIEGINVTGTTNNALGTGTVTLVGANNNAANLTLTGTGASLGGLRGTDGTVTINPTGSSATLTVGSNNDNTVFNGVIAQGSGKTGSLTKTGTGTLVLGGSNTYTGTTTVSGGTLLVNGSLASTSVTVATGGTLGGSGRITGATTIQSGGTLSPGNSPGLQEYGTLTLETGSSFRFELAANTNTGRGTSFDGVNILTAGTLTIQTGVTSDLIFNSSGSSVNWTDTFWATDRTWLVFDTADNNYIGGVFGSTTPTQDSLGQSLASIRSGAGFSYTVSGGDIYLNYTAVPEPSTYALMLIGGVALWWLRRRSGFRAKTGS